MEAPTVTPFVELRSPGTMAEFEEHNTLTWVVDCIPNTNVPIGKEILHFIVRNLKRNKQENQETQNKRNLSHKKCENHGGCKGKQQE